MIYQFTILVLKYLFLQHLGPNFDNITSAKGSISNVSNRIAQLEAHRNATQSIVEMLIEKVNKLEKYI